MEKLPPPEQDLDWTESFEWGPEPPLWMPDSEEVLGDDF